MNEVPATPDPVVRPAKFGAVYLVCKQCGKRSSGPRKLMPKEVAGLIRRAAKSGSVRTRVVMTPCLGLCPKKATAVAHVGSGTPTRIAAIGKDKEVDRAIALLSLAEPPDVVSA